MRIEYVDAVLAVVELVPAASINLLEVPAVTRNMPGFVLEARNPIEVATGVDPETQQEIKLLTPEAFRADVLFALQRLPPVCCLQRPRRRWRRSGCRRENP